MINFLDGVTREKRVEVARLCDEHARRDLEARAAADPVRGFRRALAAGGGIIAEIKQRSPSAGSFRHGADIEGLARTYEANGATAISIVTDEKHFGTGLTDVARVRAAAKLPVLVKDFVIDERQVLAARAAGADGLLLIARLLEPGLLMALLATTRALGLDALVECHDDKDLERALAAGADLIGVNNRDLATLTTALGTCERLLPRIPSDRVRVAESGVGDRLDVERMLRCGADACLVGGALLASPDPGRKLRALLGREDDGDA